MGFPRTFEKGIHGFNKDNKWGRKGKVYSKLKDKGNKIFTTIRMKGSDITNITNYYDNSTSFSYTSTTMQNMSPAPKTIMNKEFKKLLSDTKKEDEKLQAAKSYYNKYTSELNDLIRKFPSNIVARMHGLKIKPFFDGKNMQDEIFDDFKL